MPSDSNKTSINCVCNRAHEPISKNDWKKLCTPGYVPNSKFKLGWLCPFFDPDFELNLCSSCASFFAFPRFKIVRISNCDIKSKRSSWEFSREQSGEGSSESFCCSETISHKTRIKRRQNDKQFPETETLWTKTRILEPIAKSQFQSWWLSNKKLALSQYILNYKKLMQLDILYSLRSKFWISEKDFFTVLIKKQGWKKNKT